MAGTILQLRTRLKIYNRAGFKCENPFCKTPEQSLKEGTISIDHLIPISLYKTLGFSDMYNEEENLLCYCKRCNTEKGNVLDPRNPNTASLLKSLFQRWERLNTKKIYRNYAFKNLTVKSDTTTYKFSPYSEQDHIDYLKNIYIKQKV